MEWDVVKIRLCGFAVLFIMTVFGIICVNVMFTEEFTILADPIHDTELLHRIFSYVDFVNNTELGKANNNDLNINESDMFD